LEPSTIFQVYPNPFEQQTVLNIEADAPSNIEIVIYSNLGQQLQYLSQPITRGTNEIILDFQHWSKGIYFLKITQDNQAIITKKLIYQAP